jgi:Asp-tRNA(Asn)/Glu-tRNA(Gln) amidotransferase C subunit
MDFLWHKVSEKEKEEIRKQAKDVMAKFSKKLEKINLPKGKIEGKGKDFERPEGTEGREFFDKKVMFENAPEKNKDFIVSEKKEW